MFLLVQSKCADHTCSELVFVILGFYEDVENHRFGVKPKRGKPKPGSDFHFEFVLKVVASHPASTGFLVRVFPEVTIDGDLHAPK